MGIPVHRLAPLALAALLLATCGCQENDAAPDSGSTDTDADADTDTYPPAEDPEIDWVVVTAGSFTFGSPDGTPCRGAYSETEVQVTLTRPFLMSKYEITQRHWAAMGFQVPPNTPFCEECPVTYLTWYEALVWCNALSHFEGLEECYDLSNCEGEIGGGCPEGFGMCSVEENAYRCEGTTRRHASMYDCSGYRLPTGAEWEYAVKAGTTTNTYNGDITDDHDGYCADEPILNDIAWYCSNSGAGDDPWSPDSLGLLQEIGLKQPNPFSLYDMLGNASEWVDYVHTGFSLAGNEGDWEAELLVDPMGATEDDDERRDFKGRAYYDLPCRVRAATTAGEGADIRGPGYGFRPVRTLPDGWVDAGPGDSGVK